MADDRLEEIRQARLKKRSQLLAGGRMPYPAEARRSHTGAQFLDNFAALQEDSVPVTLAGRVVGMRKHGAIAFIDLADFAVKVQLQLSQEGMPGEIFGRLEQLDIGDFIQASGIAGMTKRESKALKVHEFHLLAKSIRPLPGIWFGLKDVETRWRQREVDLLLTEEAREGLVMRSKATAWLREYLGKREFLEMETPILQPLAGGALAKPFTTRHQALAAKLYLRIAPEIYLKRLLVGGFEKIFELGRNFRNEGIDRDHNPEFTMCELYWAYADYEDLMDLTEDMISALAGAITGREAVKRGETEISVAKPWRRERFVEKMSALTHFNVLEKQAAEDYVPVFKKHKLDMPKIMTYPKMIDELYKELVRPSLKHPTILYDYPVQLAPLAKQSASDKRVAEKFQLVIGGLELVNAYTELNDPIEQRVRFEEQQKLRAAGDEEIGEIDEDYLRALEYGMPPAAGWGLGVDRLMVLLTGVNSIRETMAFPLLKPDK